MKDSHPFFECELALWARTVRHVLSQRTPALARGVRSLDESKNVRGVSCTRYEGVRLKNK